MRDIRAFTSMSLALLCSCGGDGDGANSPVDTGTDTLSPEAGSHDGGALADGGANRQDGGSMQDGGSAENEAGTSEGGARDGGAEGGMDAGPEAGSSQDAGRDTGPLTINGYPVADHCAPGEYDPMYAANCADLDGGVESALASGIGATPSVEISVRWRQLSPVMQANQPYALSVEVELYEPPANQQLEIWGAMSPCATGGETSDRLGVAALDHGSGVYCIDMQPSKAYSHVLMAYRKIGAGNGSGSHGQTYCSSGMCPAR